MLPNQANQNDPSRRPASFPGKPLERRAGSLPSRASAPAAFRVRMLRLLRDDGRPHDAFRFASCSPTARTVRRGRRARPRSRFASGRGARNARLAGFGHVALLESYFDGEVDVDGDFAARVARRVRRRSRQRRQSADRGAAIAGTNCGSPTARFAQAKANAQFHYDLPDVVLPAVARPRRHAVHLRVLARRHDDARGSAGQQDGPRLPQGRAQGRRYVRRRRLRLRRPPVPRVREVRRARHRHQHGDAARSPICGRSSSGATCTTSIKLVECDFREIPGQYDKLLSIGTLEHAGRDQLAGGDPRARRRDEARRPRRDSFHRPRRRLRDRVLDPQAHLPRRLDSEPRPTRSTAMEQSGLEVIDVENLRRHYALTLDAWAERFDAQLGGDPRARSRALRRALPPHVADLPVVVRGDVPLAQRPARTCSRSRSSKGNVGRQLSDEPRPSLSHLTHDAVRGQEGRLLDELAVARAQGGADRRPREADLESLPRSRGARSGRASICRTSTRC